MTKKTVQAIKNSVPVHKRETAYVIHPDILPKKNALRSLRSLDLLMDEAKGLARAIDLDVVADKVLKVSKIQAGSFLGKGQREDIALEIEMLKPHVLIINDTLSPIQQRNLELEWGIKVIDRTGLILEIFGRRAQTKEGRLQVDLAAMQYQKSRLVRSWTHLERQRGGAGFMGGPGESQIEIDRRLINERITKLKKELQNVRRTRDLGRKSRERTPFPVIALVGYTNAGKSTLFNRLTGADVFAEDLPFATLDPTMRRIDLPMTHEAILSDTVGFISNLPTHLVESFRATLEHINYADIIAHVVDVSAPDYNSQRHDVIKVLSDLGIDYETDDRIIEIWNKIDAVPDEEGAEIERLFKLNPRAIRLSALSGQGVETFRDRSANILSRSRIAAYFTLPLLDGKALSWLYEHADIKTREDQDKVIALDVMITSANLGKFKNLFAYEPHNSRQGQADTINN